MKIHTNQICYSGIFASRDHYIIPKELIFCSEESKIERLLKSKNLKNNLLLLMIYVPHQKSNIFIIFEKFLALVKDSYL